MSDKRKNDEIPCSEKLQAVGYTQSPMHFRMEQKKKKKKKNWLENVTVAEQAINTWFSVLKVVKYYEGLAPSKGPKNKSDEILVKCVKDQFMIIKFHFFKDCGPSSNILKGLPKRYPYGTVNK